jgi:hypothetical protein
MDTKTPERLAVYRISADGTEELLDEHELKPDESIGAALFEMSLGQRTPTEAAAFMLNMRDVKGNERRRLKAMVEREACKRCIIDNKGKCLEGHTEEWVKKILA